MNYIFLLFHLFIITLGCTLQTPALLQHSFGHFNEWTNVMADKIVSTYMHTNLGAGVVQLLGQFVVRAKKGTVLRCR